MGLGFGQVIGGRSKEVTVFFRLDAARKGKEFYGYISQ